MKSGLSFLVAARQCEISELEHLALTSDLVGVIGRLTHALQKERGISNVFLSSHGLRFGDERRAQVADCEAIEQLVRERLDALDTDASRVRNGARLFSRIAFVLYTLDTLPGLRQRIGTQALAAQEATAIYVKLIAGLLAVVFEAADSATDPEISRALVAMFNFMQGKEFAGQERAFGAGIFASGHTDAGSAQQWLHFIELQENCFELFTDFSDAAVVHAWQAQRAPALEAELERLRRLGCSPMGDGKLNSELSRPWYECCTRRIDGMKVVEDLLAANLRLVCERKIAQARGELRDQQAIVEAISNPSANVQPATPAAPFGPHLERSILGMVQEQAHRLQAMHDELQTVRAALNERKVVERAKGLLMATRKLSEEDAYKMLRQTAMNQNKRLMEVAENVLAMADYL